MDMRHLAAEALREALKEAFPSLSQDEYPQDATLEVPPSPEMGDYAFPCFRLARSLKMGPPQIALKLSAAVKAPELLTAQAVQGYVNLFFVRKAFAQSLVESALAQGERYGASQEGLGKTLLLDYSSINIAKRFHIGHLPSTVIGNSLKHIYSFLGWKAVGINHLGDWGTQFGKLLCAYQRWGSREMVEEGGVDALTALYIRFHQEAELDESLNDEGRAWFKKIEEGDEGALATFKWFKELTLQDAKRVYGLLNVDFDSYAGESFYNDKMGRVIDELQAKNLMVQSQGAGVVDLEEYRMPPCLILKNDGATLYATRDLAAALWRMDHYHFDLSLYVVAYQQDLHFKQVFKVLELMGYDWAKTHMKHVAFGMVSYEGQAFSTREGKIIYLEDLLNRAQEKALQIIEEKSPGMEDKQTAARQVGIGAVVFATLLNGRIKDVDFWWDRALSFDGDTGPYVQYTHARCASLLRKAPERQETADYEALTGDEAQAVIRLLSRFPEAVKEAAALNEPSCVTRATLEIAKAFNRFYYEQRILTEDLAQTEARLRLSDLVRQTLKTGLGLIGVQAPLQM